MREKLVKLLQGYAIDSTENQGLHGWRCQYPDAYGKCDCFEQLVNELITFIEAEMAGENPWDFADPLTVQEDEDDMCPNCVTPWKCNGPHLSGVK